MRFCQRPATSPHAVSTAATEFKQAATGTHLDELPAIKLPSSCFSLRSTVAVAPDAISARSAAIVTAHARVLHMLRQSVGRKFKCLLENDTTPLLNLISSFLAK